MKIKNRFFNVPLLKRCIIIGLFILLPAISAFARYHVSGFVTDQQTGERLIGASVVELGTSNGISTDNNGYFSLIVQGENIQVSFIGYQTMALSVSSDTLLSVTLNAGEMLDEVVVKGDLSKRFNVSSLSHQEMLSIPALGGKPDVLKTLQLIPGIQAQQEGSSLINVRGGNPGENLYLIDNIPLIYVNHLGGFMSVFNPDMINHIEVYKGGFPAKYGGKLSSVMAITQREGDKSKLKGTLGIGVTDASFSIEGPLLDKKASFIVTGRKTLIDPLMILASGLSGGGDFYLFYGFHDLNGKFSWHPDSKNSFYVNLYLGDDYLKYWSKGGSKSKEKSSMGTVWGNNMVAARWSRIVSPRLFADNTFSYTRYRLKVTNAYYSASRADTTDYENKYISAVQDFSFRSDWQFKLLKDWSIDFGAKATSYVYVPNRISQSSSIASSNYEQISANELSGYFSNRFTLLHRVDGDMGLRLVRYGSGSFSQLAFEPRALLNVRLTNTQVFNFTWQKVNQFAHLVYTSGSVFNSEVWIPADENISPSASIQYSFGWKGAFAKGAWETEANIYYKDLDQLVVYKEGYSNLMGDGGWRTKIEAGGSGTAKGVELLVRKTKGNWTGFLGYTYSKATRQFPGINNGEEYLYEYDRPHSVSVNITHKINEKWSFNALWVYQTGLPYTPVIGRQMVSVIDAGYNVGVEYEEAYIYGERNSVRMKDYHRLDVGFTKTIKTKHGRKAQWNYSVYNVYNRHNPASYYYGNNKDGRIMHGEEKYEPIKQYQISYFPIIPTISYKLFFE